MQFRRKVPAWLLPAIGGLVILAVWIGLGLLSEEPAESTSPEEGGASLLAYLSPSDGPAEVQAMDFGSGQVVQLTNSGGVSSFAVDPNGEFLVISIRNDENGADLRRADLLSGASQPLLECGGDTCEGPQISPDGAWLAYQRSTPGAAFSPEIWLLDLESGDAQRLSDSARLSRDPAWAASESISYYEPDLSAFVLVNLDGRRIAEIENESGGGAAWAPDGSYLVAAEQSELNTSILRGPSGEAAFDTPEPGTQTVVEVLSSQLMRYDLDGGSQPLLNYSDPMVEDALPTFSPDGQWLAFTRKFLDGERWTPGRQLWLLHVESGELAQLTDSANHQVIAIAWSPDGRQIAYVRANQDQFQNPLELWITNLDGSASQLIAVDTYAPAWVP
jgi:Tol biopolymer transport system component